MPWFIVSQAKTNAMLFKFKMYAKCQYIEFVTNININGDLLLQYNVNVHIYPIK